jgi:hypothetical protein
MIIKHQDQDTVKVSHVPAKIPVRQPDPVQDDTSVCTRNSIADITFYPSGDNFAGKLKVPASDQAIVLISEKTQNRLAIEKEVLKRHLRDGEAIAPGQIRDDWFIFVLIAAGLLLTIVRSASGSFHPVRRYFLFRGINDPESRDTGGMFSWQTTLFNSFAFIILSMFIYRAALYFGLIPPGFSNAGFWLASLAALIVALTFRHFICVAAGSLSERRDVFNEYLVSIYQFYQYSAILLLLPVVMVSYTTILSHETLLIAGFIILGLMYIFRITRLFIIFMNRNISVLYLILYLCALEFIPVAVMIRYFTGRV